MAAPVTGSLPLPAPFTEDHLKLAELNEGFRAKPYRDTRGFLTIGYGRNLDAKGISKAEGGVLLINDLNEAKEALLRIDPWYVYLDPVRQAAMTDLVFNMGGATWRGFLNSRSSLEQGDFEQAGQRLRQSRWYTQVGLRAERVIRMIEKGVWPWEG